MPLHFLLNNRHGIVGNHNFRNLDLLIQAGNHHLLIDRLILTADVIAVQIDVHVIQGLHKGKRPEHEDVVHVEAMLGKPHFTFLQKTGAVNHRVHQNIASLPEKADLVPGNRLVHRNRIFIMHHLMLRYSLLHISEVAQQHIRPFFVPGELLQLIQNLQKCVLVQPVITVNHLIIKAACKIHTDIHAGAMSPVRLMNGPADSGILLLIAVGNFSRPVLGSIVYNQDLHLVTANQQRIQAPFHVILRIVAGYADA